jgi:acetylornithine deacetylase/succinyl-diaminopimelate desuccinylase-like protein
MTLAVLRPEGKKGMSMSDLITLAADLVRIDSRSFVSNIAMAERIVAELSGFEVERLDYRDPQGVAKCVLVAWRGGPGGLAFSGHMDTVPATGWTSDPWSGRVADGVLHGLGSADMKGPLAACILAVRGLKPGVAGGLLITTDEETTKQGARLIAERSELARAMRPRGIVVAEPTLMTPVRGHRANIAFTVTAEGVQAHSATGLGRNANWELVAFLVRMKALHARLRSDAKLQDAAYDPPFSDFNLVIDNHGAAVNVTVPVATVRIKYRYSASIDPSEVVAEVRAAASDARLALDVAEEGRPPELAADHPLIAAAVAVSSRAARTVPFGTDATLLQTLAPCVVMGPGDIGVAHRDGENVPVAALEQAVTVFQLMAAQT